MTEYIFAYHGGKPPETPEEGAVVMQRWQDWLTGLGDGVVNPGNPVGPSKTVGNGGVSDGGGANPLSGFTIVRADSIDAAIALTEGCPHLDEGTIEVAELIVMPT